MTRIKGEESLEQVYGKYGIGQGQRPRMTFKMSRNAKGRIWSCSNLDHA